MELILETKLSETRSKQKTEQILFLVFKIDLLEKELKEDKFKCLKQYKVRADIPGRALAKKMDQNLSNPM